MRALVVVRAGGATYAVGVDQTGGVLEHEGVAPLPDPLPGVAGLLRTEQRTLTVLAPFTATGEHILIVHGPDGPFGLLVEQVTGIVKVDEEAVGPPPAGQHTVVVVGTVRTAATELLLLDPAALADRLRRTPA